VVAIPGKGRFRTSENISLSDGLAGWILVRIRAQQILYDMSPESHIVEASKKLLFARARDTDHISTGLAGRCEPALMLGDHTASDLDILIDTWNQRYAKNRVFDLTPNFLSPHFNEGIAGILYQQLRLLFRKEMPSLISFE
jgi:hypothetical protein